MRTKDLRAKRAKLVADARAYVDKDNATAEDIAKFDEMMAEAEALKAQIDRLEQADSREAELAEFRDGRAHDRGISADQQNNEDTQARRVFVAYLRGGMESIAGEDRAHAQSRITHIQNAQGTSPGAAGGYLVPPEYERDLLIAMKAYFDPDGIFTEISTATGAPLPWPTVDDTARRAKIIGENTQIGQGQLTFGTVSMNAYLYGTDAVLVPWNLMQDSFVDLDGFIRDRIAESFARTLADDLTIGTGVNMPKGVLVAASAGPTGSEAADVDYDDIVELQHSVDPAYRQNARLMFNDNTFKALRKLKDSQGRPLWVPSIAQGIPDLIANSPYTINQSMPDMAAGANSILYGNFKAYYYRIVKGVSIVRLNERWADSLQTGFFGYGRFGGDLPTAAAPIKYLKNAAA